MGRTDSRPPPRSTQSARQVQQHMKLARRIVARLRGRHGLPMDREDLEAYALAGLVEAARRYDPARGAAFATFAYYRITGAVWDGVRVMGYAPRRPRQARFEEGASAYLAECVGEQANDTAGAARAFQSRSSSLAVIYVAAQEGCERAVPDPREPGALKRIERAQLSVGLRPALKRLPPRERRLLEGVYFEGRRLKDVAAELGISLPWASRLHRRAVDTLRRCLRKEGLIT